MTHIDVHEAEQHFLELIKRIAQGEEVIIHMDDKPVAKLSPLTAAIQPRRFGSAKGLIQIADDFDEPLDDFEDYTS